MTTAELNAWESDAAHWRMRADGGLAWAMGASRLNPRAMSAGGVLLLRRWAGRKYARPVLALIIGWAWRAAGQVTPRGDTPPADTVAWLAVDRVSAGGIVAEDYTRVQNRRGRPGGRNAQPVVYGAAGAWAGLLPSAPCAVEVRQDQTGAVLITWIYNPVTQQAEPTDFAIYSDSGSGTISATPIGTVAFVAGMGMYSYRLATSGWNGWLFVVAARSADGVRSLLPRSDRTGLADDYALNSGQASIAARRVVGAVP